MNKDLGGLIIVGLLLWVLFNKQQPKQLSNEETWNWTDYRGHEYKIVVHRKIE